MILEGLFTIVTISLIMSVFECLFFVFVVQPSTTQFLQSFMEEYSKQAFLLTDMNNMFKVMKLREMDGIQSTTVLAFIIIGLVITCLGLMSIWIATRMSKDGIKRSMMNVCFTILLLIGFQVFFYFFGLNAQYTSHEELLAIIKEIYLTRDEI